MPTNISLNTHDGVGSTKSEVNGADLFTLTLTSSFVTEPFDAQSSFQVTMRKLSSITGSGNLTLQWSETKAAYDSSEWETELQADDTTALTFTIDDTNDYWRVRHELGKTTGWWRLSYAVGTVTAGDCKITLNRNAGL